jgi:GrpB-like predicted nucleotidyltransferase (UPF0157 family)
MSPSGESGDRVQGGAEPGRQAKPSRSLRLNGPVRLESYNAQWPGRYEREAARIRSVLADRVLLLEHVGSTSVPGLAAKPVIDILLVVADPAEEAAYVPGLELAGYRLVARHPGWHQHRMLAGPDTDINLHVLPPGCAETERTLRFRDRLRASEADRALYQRVKRQLAARQWTHLRQYTDAKADVIETILARCPQHITGEPRRSASASAGDC